MRRGDKIMDKDVIDDIGTTEGKAKEILSDLLFNGFDNEIDLLAIALGRSTEELNNFLEGNQEIDNDLLMKMRGIADERGITVG